MRLESVEIGQYKNLKDFKINFNQDSFLDLIIGKNGSGKSNFFEAIIEIFGKLEKDEFTSFQYKLKYFFDNASYEIVNQADEKVFKNNQEIELKNLSNIIPSNIIYYYAGLNNRISPFFKQSEITYKRLSRATDDLSLRRFIHVDNFYYKILLLIALVYNEGDFGNFLKEFLGIQGFEKIDLMLKRSKRNTEEFIDKDGNRFWGVKGELKEILSIFDAASSNQEELFDGLSNDKRAYILRLKDNDQIDNIKESIASPRYLFKALENVFQSDMLTDIVIEFKKGNSAQLIFEDSLSEGEKQIITIAVMSLLTQKAETLMLLDEPDAFLHPKWQFDLCKKISEYSGEALANSHILLNSHSASTLVSSDDNQVNLFEFNNDSIGTLAISRKDAVSRLTEGIVVLDEDESRLRIDNVIRNSDKPILFVEGPSDVIILENAYRKLYEINDIPFLIQDAFDCGFLRNLLKRDEIFQRYPDKILFALFDFDKGYDDWAQLGDYVEQDVFKGLCRKKRDNNCYSFLLPVPNVDSIKSQVIKLNFNGTYETFKRDSILTIELMFYGFLPKNSMYFRKESCQGGGEIVRFLGNKIKFAEKVVSLLSVEAFEPFRPLFEQIKGIIE